MAKILIAEDDTSMRNFLSMALSKAGHDVVLCEDGLQALEKIQDGSVFDLLLADIVMPGMDGIELAQKATAHNEGLKVMFITGFAAVAMDSATVKEDESRVLSKPFHLKDLVDRIEHLLAA